MRSCARETEQVVANLATLIVNERTEKFARRYLRSPSVIADGLGREEVLFKASTFDLMRHFRLKKIKCISRRELFVFHVYLILLDKGVISPSGEIISSSRREGEAPVNISNILRSRSLDPITVFDRISSGKLSFDETMQLKSAMEYHLRLLHGLDSTTIAFIEVALNQADDWINRSDSNLQLLAEDYLGKGFWEMFLSDNLSLYVGSKFFEFFEFCHRNMPKLTMRLAEEGVINFRT